MVNHNEEDNNYNDLRLGRKFDDRIFVALNYIFAVSSVLLLTMPIMQVYLLGTYYTLTMAATMGGWLFTSFLLEPKWIFNINKTATLMLGIVAFYFAFAIFGMGTMRTNIKVIAAPYYMFFVFYFYYLTGRKKFLAVVGFSVFAAIIITVITTINELTINPYSYREVEGMIGGIENFKKNVGTVHHIYSAVLVGTVIACYLQGEVFKNNICRYIAFAIMALCFYLAFMSSSAIALISAVFAIAFVLVQNMHWLFRFFVCAGVILIFVVFANEIGNWIIQLSQSIENKYISSKLYDMALSIQGGSATGELAARTDRWMADLKVCLDTYLVGIGPYYEGNGNGTYIVAEHSQLFSDLARYGVVFFLYIWVVFLSYKKLLYKMLEESGCKCNLSAYFVTFVVMYISQPVMTNFIIPMTVMLVVPSSVQILNLINGKFKEVSILVPETIEWEEKMDELSEENNGEQN